MMSTGRSMIRGTAQPSTAANTAPVYEFRCLYTHDLRRKQKRWQDGFLKFHTFNKRVMVYDQPRNYIGDTHWKGSDALDDGDELTLENGVIVQVAEPVATTQTDLTELLQKKPRDAQFPAPANVRLPASGKATLPTPGVRTAGLTANAAPRHKPLSQLLGTPKGPHGRAVVSARSPFDERQANLQKADKWAANERAAKRRRVAEAEQTRNTVKEVRTPVPKGRERHILGRAPERRGAFGQNTPLALKGGNRTPGELIDLVSDAEEMEPGSDVTMPNTPPGIVRPVVPSRKKKPEVSSTSQPPASPPVSTTNRLVHVQEDFELLEKTIADTEEQPVEEEPPKRSKKLRLASGPRPKMLLCQDVDPNRRPAVPERQPQNTAARIPQRGKSAISEKNQQNLERIKRPSEIRKMQNGLTQSSPPESEGHVPPPDDDIEDRNQDTILPAESNNTVAPQGRVLQDKSPIQLPEKRVLAAEPTSKQNKPNLRIQTIQAQKGQTTLAQSRRTRSENDKNKPSAASESYDESRLPGQEKSKERIAPQRPLQRSISLNVAANRALEREMTPPSPVVDTDVGPWSTEAVDLFDWRPPGYVFRGQGMGFGPAEGDGVDSAAAS